VLDGVEVADDLLAILSVASDCGVVMTTRRRWDMGMDNLDLETMSIDEASRLLEYWVRQTTDEGIIRKICELVGGLPLAVTLAGRYMAATQDSPANYLDWLEQELLLALHHGEHQHESIPVLLRKSLARASERARRCSWLLAL
jgi:hypothetical protein